MQQQQHAQQIREHMEVVGSDNGHVGTVDKVEGDRIKMTKQDDPDGTGAHHHYLSLDAVASVSGNQVLLSVPAEQAKQAALGGGQAMGPGTGGLDRGMGAQAGVTGAGSMAAGNPGVAGGLGSLGMRDGVADIGPGAGSAGMSGDTAPGTIGGRVGGVGSNTGGRSTGG